MKQCLLQTLLQQNKVVNGHIKMRTLVKYYRGHEDRWAEILGTDIKETIRVCLEQFQTKKKW